MSKVINSINTFAFAIRTLIHGRALFIDLWEGRSGFGVRNGWSGSDLVIIATSALEGHNARTSRMELRRFMMNIEFVLYSWASHLNAVVSACVPLSGLINSVLMLHLVLCTGQEVSLHDG